MWCESIQKSNVIKPKKCITEQIVFDQRHIGTLFKLPAAMLESNPNLEYHLLSKKKLVETAEKQK